MFLLFFAGLMTVLIFIAPTYIARTELPILDSVITTLYYAVPILIIMLITLALTRGFSVFWHGLRAAASVKNKISGDMAKQAVTLYRFLSKITTLITVVMLVILLYSAISYGIYSSAEIDSSSSGIMYIGFSDDMTPSAVVSFIANASLLGIETFRVLLSGLWLKLAFFEPVVFMLKKRMDESS